MKLLLTSPTLRALATISLFALALPACRSDAEAVCDFEGECERWSEGQIVDCYNSEIDKEREADAKGCLDLYDELKACEYEYGYCKSTGDWEDGCKSEKERYDACKK